MTLHIRCPPTSLSLFQASYCIIWGWMNVCRKWGVLGPTYNKREFISLKIFIFFFDALLFPFPLNPFHWILEIVENRVLLQGRDDTRVQINCMCFWMFSIIYYYYCSYSIQKTSSIVLIYGLTNFQFNFSLHSRRISVTIYLMAHPHSREEEKTIRTGKNLPNSHREINSFAIHFYPYISSKYRITEN